jgi:hypothetical protein
VILLEFGLAVSALRGRGKHAKSLAGPLSWRRPAGILAFHEVLQADYRLPLALHRRTPRLQLRLSQKLCPHTARGLRTSPAAGIPNSLPALHLAPPGGMAGFRLVRGRRKNAKFQLGLAQGLAIRARAHFPPKTTRILFTVYNVCLQVYTKKASHGLNTDETRMLFGAGLQTSPHPGHGRETTPQRGSPRPLSVFHPCFIRGSRSAQSMSGSSLPTLRWREK